MKCPLFEICNCKTAYCRVEEPDSSCYYYRYFEGLIKKNGVLSEIKPAFEICEDTDCIYIIPTTKKPVKLVFEGIPIEEHETVTSILNLIKKVRGY